MQAGAAEALGRVLVNTGRSAEATELLSRFVALHPFRESAWSQYFVALHADGRGADARRHFARLRQTFRTELGLEPGPGVVAAALGSAQA
jgi:DNA-binding SARP family transcriptional activator